MQTDIDPTTWSFFTFDSPMSRLDALKITACALKLINNNVQVNIVNVKMEYEYLSDLEIMKSSLLLNDMNQTDEIICASTL